MVFVPDCTFKKTFTIGREKETVRCQQKCFHNGMHSGYCKLTKQVEYWD